MLENIIENIKYDLRFSKDLTVVQYGYRTAFVAHPLVKVPRDRELEKALAKKAGNPKDNHTIYVISFNDGSSFAISCSDQNMIIGVGIRLENW